jgi:dihydrofolate reductase
MIVSAIVATGKGNVIGMDGEIPWYLPADLQYFKRKTLGHHIIMGSATLRSMGGPLPKRTNIVLSRQPFFVASGCLVAHSVEEALQIASDNEEDEAFIIGGAEVYRSSMAYWDKLYWTEVAVEAAGDTFFVAPDLADWELISEEPHAADEKNEHAFTFKVFVRRL